jgi:hypothetical protein
LRQIAGCLIVAAAVIFFGGPASAASPGTCSAFIAAVEQSFTQDSANGCLWNDGNNTYYDTVAQERWCHESREETVSSVLLGRADNSSRCAICREYSNMANADALSNLIFGCGFTGDRWGIGEGHFQYCMNDKSYFYSILVYGALEGFPYTKTRDLDPETQAREDGIRQCKAKYSDRDIQKCENYADAAVTAVAILANSACIWSTTLDGRWSENHDQHLAWCLAKLHTQFEGEIQSETDARNQEAQDCKDNNIDYGERAATPGSQSNGNTLAPEQSTGPSPFGGKDLKALQGRSGASAVKKSVDTFKKLQKRTPSNATTLRAGSGGVSTVKSDKPKIIEPGMLEGDNGAARSGPSAIGSPASSGGARSGGPSSGFNTSR